MKQREKVLLGAVGAIAVLYGGNWLYQAMYAQPLLDRQDQTVRLREDISKRELDLAKFRKANQDFKKWQKQALPSDTEVARSLYQAWLVELVGSAGFLNPNVDSSEPIARKGLYESLSFSVRGRGTLPQVTKFLFDFYRADHLHQIQSLSLTPVPRSDELDLTIAIEALSLAEADRKDRLNDKISDRLASNRLEDYRVIAQRNLFGIGGGAVDEADFAYLTAITEVDGEMEAWFTLRASGRLVKLRQQQSFDIGPFHGKVAEINPQDVVLLCDDERWLLTVGESLMQASILPPEF